MGRESDYKVKNNREFPRVLKKEIKAGNIDGIMNIRSQVSDKVNSIFESNLPGDVVLKIRNKLFDTLQIIDDAMNEAIEVRKCHYN